MYPKSLLFLLLIAFFSLQSCSDQGGGGTVPPPADSTSGKFGPPVPPLYLPDGSEVDFEEIEFAHRGGYEFGPENTWPTVYQSLRNGARGIEIDIEMTKDKEIIVFHDDTPERLLDTDTTAPINELEWEYLQSLSLRETGGFPEARILRLGEFLDLFQVAVEEGHHAKLQLDAKVEADQAEYFVERLHKMLLAHPPVGKYKFVEQVFVTSFYPHVLIPIKQRNAAVADKSPLLSGLSIIGKPEDQKLLAALSVFLSPTFARDFDVSIIEPDKCMVDAKFVQKWRKKGLKIIAYTANTQSDKDYLRQFNIAISTNCPDTVCGDKAEDMLGEDYNWCGGE